MQKIAVGFEGPNFLYAADCARFFESSSYRAGESCEDRHNRLWPDHQKQGCNRQSLRIFGKGLGKAALEARLDLQMRLDLPSIESDDINPSDRLRCQVSDDDCAGKSLARTFYNANGYFGHDRKVSERSIHDEDILFEGMAAFIEASGLDTQFYVLGDTNHKNAVIQRKLLDPGMLAFMAQAGCKMGFVERYEGCQPLVEAYQAGSVTKRAFIEGFVAKITGRFNGDDNHLPKNLISGLTRGAQNFSDFLDDATKKEIRIFCVDSCEGVRFFKGRKIIDYKQRLDSDRALANRIKAIAGTDISFIIYGAAHGAYRGTLDECLGMGNVTRINMHANLKQFHCSYFNNQSHIDYQPRYLYLIEEDKIILAPENYGRRAGIDEDPFQCALDPEVQALKERRDEQARDYWARRTGHDQGYIKQSGIMTKFNCAEEAPEDRLEFFKDALDIIKDLASRYQLT